ncbi:glycosyltransferase family 2 protein [Marinilactibacillus psychrotolerans]|uniref:glycosyltransferase family 2 protein n=1 Tax=Marinilactibacillus psychrotolerans TaxID=191770 RepID=UPI00388493B2
MNISCVILNYNDADKTISLIEEIIDYSTLDHIIIIDNLSTDDSFERLKKYESEKIIVISSDKNGGYGYGNNIGIRQAYDSYQSDYTIVANPDVHFSEKNVEAMAKQLTNKEYCIVSPRALKPNGKNQRLIAWRLQGLLDYTLSASMIYLKFFSNKYYDYSFFKSKEKAEVDVVPGSLLMVNTEYMIKYGMYDEGIFLYGEEETLSLKFKKKNLKTILLLNETYIHEHSVSISKSFPRAIKQKKMNLDSRLHLIKNYYNTSSLQNTLINLFFKFAYLENIIIFKIKDMKKE